MHELIQIGILFGAKMLDNMLSTAKTILIQRNRCILAGISLALSNYIYFLITKNIVTADNEYAIIVVSIASGIRGECIKEVKKLHGVFSFEKAMDWQSDDE